MLTLSKPGDVTTSWPQPPVGMTFLPVADGRWRVLDRSGRAIGHLDAESTPDGVRYRAGRYHAPTRVIRILGEFWSAGDALDCLRLSR